jgi:hypothetical protein
LVCRTVSQSLGRSICWGNWSSGDAAVAAVMTLFVYFSIILPWPREVFFYLLLGGDQGPRDALQKLGRGKPGFIDCLMKESERKQAVARYLR